MPSNLVLLNAPGPQGPPGPKGPQGPPGAQGPTGPALAVSGTGFVHWSGTGPDALARLVQATDISTTASAGQLLESSGTGAVWASASTVIVGGIAPGTAGQFYITNGTPAGAWSSAIAIDASAYTGVTSIKVDSTGALIGNSTSSHYGLRIAPLIGQETSFAGIWVGPNALSPTGSNYIMAVATSSFLFNGVVDIATDGNFNDVAIGAGHSITFNNVASSTATIGTNSSGASLLFKGDAATTILTLTTSAEFATAVKYDNVSAPSTPSGGPMVYGSSGRQGHVATTGHITLMPG